MDKTNQLNDENIKEVVDLWIKKRKECIFKFGHISNWNTSQITNMSYLFHLKDDFNEDLSRWDVSNVITMSAMFFHTHFI